MSLILDGTLGATFNDGSNQPAAASPYSLKNRIINGDMVISQRNGTTSVNVSGTSYAYQMDRFYCGGLNGITTPFTLQQIADAPTGFTNSVRITVANTDALANAATEYGLQQNIEANNTTDFNLGTANAVTVTLSFWVKSSLTGTFGIGIRNAPTFNRGYVATYTISAANTWERKTVTLTMDTTGTWNNSGTSASMNVTWSLGCGSNFNGTANTWNAYGAVQTSGSVRLVSNAAATWQITGVQLERNTTATPFEWIPYTTELALCQRYYWRQTSVVNASFPFPRFGQGVAAGGVIDAFIMHLPVTMRTAPTVTFSNNLGVYDGSSTSTVTGAINANDSQTNILAANIPMNYSVTAGKVVQIYSTTSGQFMAGDAEI